MLNESDIIHTLKNAFAVSDGVMGIGDDAAILPLNDKESYVITKDILVENRHFRLTTTSAYDLAHKSLHVNLSDIAAMGATPMFVMLGIALPSSLPQKWVDEFLSGFTTACNKQNVQLIGGDTTGSGRDLFISVTAIGHAATKNLKFRHSAQPDDVICVAGALGEAHAGLAALEKNISGLETVKQKSTAPDAKTAEGIWLSTQPSVTAMIDISDGLYIDLHRLTQASKVGAVINLENLVASQQLTEACTTLKLDVRELILTGGEDYALLFTVSSGAYENLAQNFKQKFGYELIKIGNITPSGKVELREGGNPVPFTYRPFSHFGEL